MMSSMDIYEIRRRNLEQVLREQDRTIVELARRTGTSANYLTQVLSDRTARHMGSTVARRIENRLELPDGWMDHLPGIGPDLSAEAVELGRKFDTLPDRLKIKLIREIDVLHRYIQSDE